MRHRAQTRAAGQRSATLHGIGAAPGLRAAGAMALHLRDLHPVPDQCFGHRELLHGLSPKNVGPALARLAAVIARNVPRMRFHTVGSKLLIFKATGACISRTAFGISNICLDPVRKPEHCMATLTARPVCLRARPVAHRQRKSRPQGPAFQRRGAPRRSARAFALPSIGRGLFRLRRL